MTLDRQLAASALLAQDPSFEHKKLPDAAQQVSHLLQNFYTDGADDRMSVADYTRYWLEHRKGDLG